ncbi:MAG TPA: hypothetical protein VKT28_11990 [Puia sp.]|nr:hypothetical protein [Puia sp.]
MAKFFIICFLGIASLGCKKDTATAVMIRIENSTGFALENVKLYYDTTNYNFGTILPTQSTPYFFYKSMPDGAAITADSANKEIFAGHFIPPNSYPIPLLANGKYTLQIFPDSTSLYRYNARFIKNQF